MCDKSKSKEKISCHFCGQKQVKNLTLIPSDSLCFGTMDRLYQACIKCKRTLISVTVKRSVDSTVE
jgi:hypothetical protein